MAAAGDTPHMQTKQDIFWDQRLISSMREHGRQNLVHGWDRIKNVHVESLLVLSTHTNVKCYPTMKKESTTVSKHVATAASSCKQVNLRCKGYEKGN